MSEQSKLHPLTRFSEFEGDEGWIKKALGDLGYFTGGGTPSKSNTSYWQGNIPWVSSSDISDDSIHEIQITRFISEEALQDSATKLVPKNSILLVSRVGVGKLAITLEPLCTSQDFTSFTPKRDNLTFLAYYLKSKSNTLLGYSQGMAIKGFTKDDISKLELFIPTEPKEQQKIADCLSSLDDLITAQNQKVEALKQHKKGLMQQLFPAEGETVPKLRFPEFENEEPWQIRKFGEICKFVRGPFGGALKKEIFVKDGYAVYEQSHAIYANFESFRYYITEQKFNELKRFSVQPRDIIMSCSGTMGKFAVVPQDAKKGVINQALLKLSVNKEYNLHFVMFLLELPENQEKLLSQSAGGAIKNVVGVGEIKEIELNVPNAKEQQKIANFLSSLDELISTQTQQLEAYKTHKKGLMQQLFPSLDEVDA